MKRGVRIKRIGIVLCGIAMVCTLNLPVMAQREQTTTQEQHAFYPLNRNNWVSETRMALNWLMKENGLSSPTYNPNRKPYVVFDFDNTTSFFDVQEALLIYQLENLRFKIKPDQMYEVLLTEVPKDNFAKEFNNADGKPLNIEVVARDCQAAYQWLCANYSELGYGGTMDLQSIQNTPQYREFTTKVRYLYDAIGGTFDASVSYPWVTYLFTGMTPQEVRELATQSHDYWLRMNKWGKRTWQSPPNFVNEAGIVSVSYKTSIAIPPESKDLYQKLMANGFDVYVCSASFIDVIEALAYNPKYGLNVPEGNVYAMELKKDEQGRYINAYPYDKYFQTQGIGKRKTIDKFIRPLYQGKGPIMVAGDSQGDYNMMTEYEDMKLGLIINRVRSDDFKHLSKQAVESDGRVGSKYFLQGRNENKGVYIRSQASILMGEKEERLLHESVIKE